MLRPRRWLAFISIGSRVRGRAASILLLILGALVLSAGLSFVGGMSAKAAEDPGCVIEGWSGTYDGNPHDASGGCAVPGSLDLGSSFTDAPGGTAYWSFTPDDADSYDPASGSVEIAISKASTTTTVTCSAGPFVYSGTSQTPCSVSVTGPGLSLTPSPTYSNNTNVGTATAAYSYAGATNYESSSDTEDFAIGKATPTCSITGGTYTYDGDPHYVYGGSCSLSGSPVLGQLNYGAPVTDVPGGTSTWTFTPDDTSNFNGDSGSVNIVVTKANPNCSISGYSVVYDGSAHTATGSCTGVDGGTLAGLDLSATTHTAVGTYTDDPWTFTDVTGNYADLSGVVTNAITNPTVEVIVIGHQTFRVTDDVYFSASLSDTAPSGLGVDDGSVTCTQLDDDTTVPSTAKDAGTYTIKGSSCSGAFLTNDGVDPAGYTIVYVGGDFVVNPAPVEVFVTGSQTFGAPVAEEVFVGELGDGAPTGISVDDSGLICTRVNPGNQRIDIERDPPLDAGSYTINTNEDEYCYGATLTDDVPGSGEDPANYTIVYVGESLGYVVNPAPYTVTIVGAQLYGSSTGVFGYQPSTPLATVTVNVASPPLECTKLEDGTTIPGATVPIGLHPIDTDFCNAISLSGTDAGNYELDLVGGSYNVQIPVVVTGSQTFGVASATFDATYELGGTTADVDVDVSGVSCSRLNDNTTVVPSSTLAVGSYTLASGATYCSGASLTGSDAGDFTFFYVGGAYDVEAAPSTYALTVTVEGPGSVTSDPTGINGCTDPAVTADCTEDFASDTEVDLTATEGAGSGFIEWQNCPEVDASDDLVCHVTMDDDVDVTAVFGYELTVTKNVDSAGAVSWETATGGPAVLCGTSCTTQTYVFPVDEDVTLSTTVAAGYEFRSWGPDCTPDTLTPDPLTCTITMDDAYDVDVTYAVGVRVVKSIAGGGEVSLGAGATCRKSCAEITRYYLPAATLSITETPTTKPAPAYSFVGWRFNDGSNPCSGSATSNTCSGVTVGDDPVTIYADFGFLVTVTKSSAVAGSVASTPSNLSPCGSACTTTSALFAAPGPVTLNAIAETGYTVASWTGCSSYSEGTCTIDPLNGPKNITVNFSASFTLSVTKSGATEGGVVSSSVGNIYCGIDCSSDDDSFLQGTSVTLTALAIPGYHFVGWTGDGTGTSTSTTRTFSMDAAKTVDAEFAANEYTLQVSPPAGGAITGFSGGIDCDQTDGAGYPDCTEQVFFGDSVTLTATAGTGRTFDAWGGDCPGTGSGTTCTFVVDTDPTASATFTRNAYTLVVTPPTNGSITGMGGGITCDPGDAADSADCTEALLYGDLVSLTASPATGYHVDAWGDDCASYNSATTCGFFADTTPLASVTFAVDTYTLTVLKPGTFAAGTVTSSPGSIDCGAGCSTASETFDYGVSVTLTATPATGATFSGWSGGGCSGSASTCVVAMTQARSVSAVFAWNMSLLTVVKAGTGSGSVTGSQPGINCGPSCSYSYSYPTVTNLTAVADTGSTFTGWSGEGCSGTSSCSVSMTMARTVTATFTLNTYTLAYTKAGSGSGTVTSTPSGVNCSASCNTTFGHGTAVSLLATPSIGSVFMGWSGEGCSGTGSCAVSMTAARAVTATFGYRLNLTKNSAAAGTVTASSGGLSCGTSCLTTSADYASGTVTLTATAATGYGFLNWSGACTGKTATCTVTMSQARNVTANFGVRLTLNKTGAGSVTSNPTGISCGKTCTTTSAVFAFGTSVTLTTTLPRGTTTATWTVGGTTSTGLTRVVVLSAPVTISVAYS